MLPFSNGSMNLYVTEIGEPVENELRIVVTEGLMGDPTPINIEGIDLGEGRPIEITDESRSFELHWPNYVAYAVRNESYWKAEESEPPFEDHLGRRYNSAFFRFVSETTFADDEYPGPLEHWALATLNHCVDVISVGPPQVTPIKSQG